MQQKTRNHNMEKSMRLFKHIGLCSLMIALSTSAAHADMIGIYASVDNWQYTGDATLAQTGTTPEKFAFEKQNQANLAVSIEHPVPLIPNVRLRHNQLQGIDTLTALAFEFGDKTYIGDVKLDLQLDNTDLILYYEILDNIVSVDVGLGAKRLSGQVTATGNSLLNTTSTVSFDQTLPMVYASVGGSLPFTGFSAKAEVMGIQYQDSSLTDAQAEIKYDFIDNLAIDLGIKAGYRQMTMTLKDVEKTDADTTFKGPYIGLEAHF
jgi:outer membrane protein